VPRLADFCIVELDGVSGDETPMAHVDPNQVPLMREVLHGLPAADRSALLEHTRSGQSVLVDSVGEGLVEPVTGAAGLRALAARSWIVVPLKVQNELFGAITLAWSDSGKSYSRADLLLAEELARKAATAIDNARLYELSRRERERAEAATRTKDEFVAMVSHELRTPLNVIIGWVRLLRSGGLPEKTRAQALEVVERNANAQSQLVGDLLDISRVMTGKIRLDPAQVDLAILVNLVLEDARFVVEAKRLQIHADVPADGAVMRGDAERLKQIVWNLLINAIKFTPKEGTIWVTLNRIESDLQLSVRDSGVGIAPEFLAHIFDSFWQSDSKSTRSHGGLGIGLSIAKHLIDLHGGSIEARSEGNGKGAEFVVRLPVSPLISATLGVAKVPVTVPTRQPLARPEVLAGSSVLIIDDEEDARDLLRVVLESCDAKVLAASSVVEGLALLQSEHVDLIVSDVGMPEQDGYDLIRAVRSLPDQTKANLPAIALTAFARAEDRTRALLAGFNVHMSKPVELAELLIALADLVTHTPPPAEA
jgi:signal transduction histidine kinase/ActR/RegA family two-component response regulator